MIDEFAYMKHETRIKTLEDELARYRGKIGNSTIQLIETKNADGGAVASFDFTSIPATFAKLVIDLYGRGDTAATSIVVNGFANGDVGANYDYLREQVSHSAAYATGQGLAQTTMQLGTIVAASGPASAFDRLLLEIPGYSNTNGQKVIQTSCTTKVGVLTGNLYLGRGAAWWRSTAAINRVTLIPSAGNFAQYSTANLYGVF